ncbi:protein kinase [Streptomyces sp. NBC_00347]|uniref:protein kinase domain-containing protein n=1 Tax=Streptomyces sp. NBC_00347 TaxID=2975721 RepID=UPI002251E690|nr:protein kinase [Streptomyces sp. NBC_00347]MCX5126866.1 protein kinase [Streptomyces sp. NBC_00347]
MTARSRPRGFAMRHLGVYPGLTTYAAPLPDGNYRTDRNGNPKITRVTLEPEGFPPPHRPRGLTDSQWAFATNGPRRWQSAVTTFGVRAEEIVTELARNGCIVLECDFRDARVVLPPRGWAPHPDLHAARQEHNTQRAVRRAAQGDEARRLAVRLAPYPAAEPLVAILGAQRDGAYRDHVIEAARVFLTDETMIDAGEVAPWAAVRWLKRGTKADYEQDHESLAEGGQGAVYGGVHKYARIPVALKKLRYIDEDSIHRMGREISIGHLYGEHPNVMPVLDSDPDGRWFVMPLANGSAATHAERLRETGALRDLVTAVCEGLRRPHADDRIHRDIKPANVLLLNGNWVVADWGLGRQPRGETSVPRRTRTGTGFGSEGFAAPEVSSGNPHNVLAAADIYSIGRLIAAILTGERPEQNLPLLPAGEPWRAIVVEATRHKPTDRPQDVDEFLHLLKDVP